MASVAGEGGGGTGTSPGPATSDQVVQAMFGWAVLFVLTTVASDIPGIGELAAAFAWLLLLSILIIYGPTALANVQRLAANVGGTP
jgi:hypothetical protein